MYVLHSMINYVIMIHVTDGSGMHRVTITLQDRLYPRQVSLLDSTVCVCSMCAACALFEMRSENFVCACIHMLLYLRGRNPRGIR